MKKYLPEKNILLILDPRVMMLAQIPSDDETKSIPAVLGGSSKSKPMWSNTSGCSATSAFFVAVRSQPPRPRSMLKAH